MVSKECSAPSQSPSQTVPFGVSFPAAIRGALQDGSPALLLSLEPYQPDGTTWPTGSLLRDEDFHRRKILGTITLDESEKRDVAACPLPLSRTVAKKYRPASIRDTDCGSRMTEARTI